ncbi:hypothetical protein pZL12.89 [Streptomyces phage ZL12]|uniref:Uncharacterized protein n=1 Tax=Streptomyces phage ZL12 TaxID=2570911 RepID=D0UWJ4_9CAUD|nr:hypothetical protein QEH43_gp089 [Streptomyces phage ZL12]ACX71166.1 hypothetical protein pZL12.89 [Streptomyces phage ZL12]
MSNPTESAPWFGRSTASGEVLIVAGYPTDWRRADASIPGGFPMVNDGQGWRDDRAAHRTPYSPHPTVPADAAQPDDPATGHRLPCVDGNHCGEPAHCPPPSEAYLRAQATMTNASRDMAKHALRAYRRVYKLATTATKPIPPAALLAELGDEAVQTRAKALVDHLDLEATESAPSPPKAEPIDCGLCYYGSDVGVPGYDDKGPAYINPACPDHNPESAALKGN